MQRTTANSNTQTNKPVYGRIREACARYGVCTGTMRKLAEETGAVRRIGKTWLCNFSIVDAYLEGQAAKKG